MPVYEYACEKCGKTTESLRRMADADAPAACEHCGSERTRRVHSVFAAAAGKGEVSLPMGASGAGGGGCCPCGNAAGPCNTR